MSIPQRFAAQFCRTNSSGMCLSCPVECMTNQLSGRKVSSAVSLVSSIEPSMVIIISIAATLRTEPKVRTSRCDSAAKILRSRRAATTASTLNRHASVFRS